MSTDFELPSHDALVAEQTVVQAEKFQGRLLAEYNNYIFPGQEWREPRGSAVVDFIKSTIGDAERTTLQGVLEGLIKTKGGESVDWVDMGGGRALVMRQLGSMPGFKQKLKMTNVDLFNYGLDGLQPNELEYIESLVPGVTEPGAEPSLITDNIETVKLPEPVDIITSVETLQYLNNPLEAIANWYNQLTDNGIMIIATEHSWTSWIRYDNEPGNIDRDETPAKHLLDHLSTASVDHAATYEPDWQNGIRPRLDPSRIKIMAIQRKPGTSLRLTKAFTKVWVNPHDYKAVYYAAPAEGSSPVIEVVKADASAALGAVALENVSQVATTILRT
ncbi:MAG TPA: hypothetical protein VF575_03455 [Candidatus Saccharimonadales bacterium]|jgi:SAM-dependent methyltransferase